jgi:predicted dehydrogenase
MDLKLVFVGAAGHVHLVLGELRHYPQVHYAAYAPSFPGEELSRLGHPPSGDSPPTTHDDWREMLDRERPQIVVVAGRYDLNAPIALGAIERGCHVLSEKPAAHSIADIERLREAIAAHDVRYTLMLPIRYEAPYWTARHLVAEGVIGRPYLISGQKSYRWGASRPAWYAERSKYGSTMTWVGIHAFDYARWVAGVQYTQVLGYHGNLVHRERPGCQDVATVIASLSNGGSAVFSMDFLRPGAAQTHGDDRLRVAGSQGVLEVCDAGRRLHVITAEQDEPDWPLMTTTRSVFGDLVAAIEGRGELLVTPEEALSISAFAIRAAESADLGRPLPVWDTHF